MRLQGVENSGSSLRACHAWTRRYYDVLEANGVKISRILPLNLTSRAVVSVDDLYTTLEWPPYCDHGENPNHGGEPSEYPYEIMDPSRASILPKSAKAKTLLVVDRGERVRGLNQHAHLVERLRHTYESLGYVVEEFGSAVLDAHFTNTSKCSIEPPL